MIDILFEISIGCLLTSAVLIVYITWKRDKMLKQLIDILENHGQ